MRAQVFRPTPSVLDPRKGIKREPLRPLEYRGPDFSAQFDFDTLFFDSFFANSDKHIIWVAPPLLNLLSLVDKMSVTALPSGQQCPFWIKEMDRHSQVWLTISNPTTALLVRTEVGEFEIAPGTNNSDFFANRRVLLTLSKNNRLEWIQDWLRYNRDIHGANAVLFYDNLSTRYSAEALLNALVEVSGFDRICVVVWPFKYGPQGLDATRFWDSDFCQFGALEHARWRFLQEARSVLNSDIDELVVSSKRSSIFETVERSWSGVVRFHGVWVHGFLNQTPLRSEREPLSYRAFDHYLSPPPKRRYRIIPVFQGECPPKWAAIPRRCPVNAQWTAHGINHWRGARGVSRSFCYRHFREINDHWKYDRSSRENFDANRFVYDRAMVSNFDNVNWAI
jgi:hypothetical protein